MQIAVITLLAAVLGVTAPTKQEWSWMGSRFAPCEGVGLNGAYRVHVEADVQELAGSLTITSLQARAASAIFQTSPAQFSLSVSVIDAAGKVRQTYRLERPSGAVIEPAPLPSESRRLYLPSGKVLRAGADEKLRFDGAASVSTEAGVCALGATQHTVSPK
jgi:hypothetical protein